ncbi:MAG: hypothetical protein ACUVRM_12220 [Bacillota bacterium]
MPSQAQKGAGRKAEVQIGFAQEDRSGIQARGAEEDQATGVFTTVDLQLQPKLFLGGRFRRAGRYRPAEVAVLSANHERPAEGHIRGQADYGP